MNWIETGVLVLLFMLLIMTFITEPKLSFEFGKAYSRSGIVAVKKAVGFVKGFKSDNEIVVNETMGDGG